MDCGQNPDQHSGRFVWRASSGRVLVHGIDVVSTPRPDACWSVVPHKLVFDPFFTVREALRIQSGCWHSQNDAWIDELLDSLGLTKPTPTCVG
jgi:ABC-2 type transport system ATP-binding protein